MLFLKSAQQILWMAKKSNETVTKKKKNWLKRSAVNKMCYHQEREDRGILWQPERLK